MDYFSQLPAELKEKIIGYTDTDTRKSIFKVNKELNTLITVAFLKIRKLTVDEINKYLYLPYLMSVPFGFKIPIGITSICFDARIKDGIIRGDIKMTLRTGNIIYFTLLRDKNVSSYKIYHLVPSERSKSPLPLVRGDKLTVGLLYKEEVCSVKNQIFRFGKRIDTIQAHIFPNAKGYRMNGQKGSYSTREVCGFLFMCIS